MSHDSQDYSPKSLATAVIALALVIAPFWTASIPAATDLPQHLAQVRLLQETLAGHRQDLIVSPWYYPNTLIYWVLLCYWKFASPINVGRLVLSTLAVSWLASTFALAYFRRRPIENWFIASPVVFCFLFNWGFLNFLIGWPVFCVFLIVVSAPRFRGQALAACALGLLLYYSHALWLLMASCWLAAFLLTHSSPRPLHLSTSVLPAWILAAFWYPELANGRRSSGVDTGVGWGEMPLERLEFDALSNAILGSINGPTESIVTIVLACFAVCSIVASLRAPDRRIDEPMMVGAAIMMLSYWALPYAYMNTIFFSQRWLPFGLVLLLLALPKPPWGRFISAATGLFCLALLSASTVHALHAWQDEHLPGFFSALEHIDSSDRVLALNLNDGSMYLKGRPGLQLFAYAQALRDADIHFSFTEHFSGPIQFRAPPSTNSERALVHSPGLATRINTAGYTKVLISGNSTIQQHFAKKLNLTPIAPSSGELWRIYRTNNHANSAM